jgi:hypothetical protein
VRWLHKTAEEVITGCQKHELLHLCAVAPRDFDSAYIELLISSRLSLSLSCNKRMHSLATAAGGVSIHPIPSRLAFYLSVRPSVRPRGRIAQHENFLARVARQYAASRKSVRGMDPLQHLIHSTHVYMLCGDDDQIESLLYHPPTQRFFFLCECIIVIKQTFNTNSILI